MKKLLICSVCVLVLTGAALVAETADGARKGPPGGRRGGPPNPVMMALDTNHDGELSADEIANASKSLLTLDKNGDGKLSGDELHPPRPEGAPDGPPPPDNE